MALALLFVGIILAIAGIKGTHKELSELLASEFSGAGNFWYFVFGVILLGAIGYFQPLRNTSRLLIALVIIVVLLANNGFWSNLVEAIQNPVKIKGTNLEPAVGGGGGEEVSSGGVGGLFDTASKGISLFKGISSFGGFF